MDFIHNANIVFKKALEIGASRGRDKKDFFKYSFDRLSFIEGKDFIQKVCKIENITTYEYFFTDDSYSKLEKLYSTGLNHKSLYDKSYIFSGRAIHKSSLEKGLTGHTHFTRYLEKPIKKLKLICKQDYFICHVPSTNEEIDYMFTKQAYKRIVKYLK